MVDKTTATTPDPNDETEADKAESQPEEGKEEATEPEDLELQAAKKAAEKDAPQAKDQDGKGQDQDDIPAVPMIPKARFDAAQEASRQQTDEAMKVASYWKGRADAVTEAQAKGGADGDQQQPQPKTPDQFIAEAKQAKLDLAGQYEEGEISTTEWEEKRHDLDTQIFDARQFKANPPQQHQQQPQAETGEDLYLDQMTADLEQKHPFALEIPKADPRWVFLQTEATNELQAEGVVLTQDARSKLTLRTRMAELTDFYGPRWARKTREQLDAERAAGKDQSGDKRKEPPGNQPPPMSPMAKARAAKLGLADQHPPGIDKLGSSGTGEGVTDGDIESMSDDQIAALPESTRRQFMPSA